MTVAAKFFWKTSDCLELVAACEPPALMAQYVTTASFAGDAVTVRS
jgi:hypothetical protein